MREAVLLYLFATMKNYDLKKCNVNENADGKGPLSVLTEQGK